MPKVLRDSYTKCPSAGFSVRAASLLLQFWPEFPGLPQPKTWSNFPTLYAFSQLSGCWIPALFSDFHPLTLRGRATFFTEVEDSGPGTDCVSWSLCLHRIGSAGNLFACRSGLAPWSMLYKLNINQLHGKPFDFIWRTSLLCIWAADVPTRLT